MKDVMLDIETLGVGKRAVILSIALLQFDKESGDLGDQLYLVLNSDSQRGVGRTTDASTIHWWDSQSGEAKEVLTQAETGGVKWEEALREVTEFLHPIKGVTVWSNGANFDIAILEEAYYLAGKKLPWTFWKTRCVRTLHDLCKEISGISCKQQVTYPTVAHNALEDCKFQIEYCVKAYNRLKGKENE